MAPARPRGVDDSRSETSSSITNLKDRSLLGPAGHSAASKGKRVVSSVQNVHQGVPLVTKNAQNGIAAAAPVETDSNIARLQWQTFPAATLHAYRYAHHLPTPSAYKHSYADIILTSSPTGLRSPSSVVARRKAQDAKHQARRKDGPGRGVSKTKERERSSDRLKVITASNTNSAPAAQPANTNSGSAGKVTCNQLASTVRRHFNSQQVSESEVIARFVYVIRHSNSPAKGGSACAVGIKGSKILGIGASEADSGWEIGSSGRAEDRKRDLGFRLRFKP